MLNFIVAVASAAFSIYWKIKDDIGLCIFDAAIALINLPFALVWLQEIL